MDHLPLIGERLAGLIPIRVRCEVTYDNEGYEGFPNRAGFDDNEIRHGLLRGNTSLLRKETMAYASLIQSWFYWGLLHFCLQRPVDWIGYCKGSHHDRNMFLNTRPLARDLCTWARSWDQGDATALRLHADKCFAELRNVRLFLEAFSKRLKQASASSENIHEVFWARHSRDIIPEDVEISIYTLAHTLTVTLGTICEKSGLICREIIVPHKAIWTAPPGLSDLLQRNGICITNRHLFEDHPLGLFTAFMTLSLLGKPRHSDHYDCSIDVCKDDAVQLENYKQAHVKEDCRCTESLPEDAFNKMLSIIADDGIPLILVTASKHESGVVIKLEISQVEEGSRYIAYSHVWADGRGNVCGNGLLDCQWLWLHQCALMYESRLEDTEGESSQPLPFWIDTFCVPCGSDSRTRDLRSKAILSMASVYRGAEAVIMLDSATLLYPTIYAGDYFSFLDCLRLALRIKLCGWSRRVWTFHEGVVAQKVMIRIKDQVCELADITTYLEHCLGNLYDDRFEFNNLWLGESMLMEMINAVTDKCLSMNENLREDRLLTFTFAWNELKVRKTSVIDDRFLVFAIINQIEKAALKKLQRHATCSENFEMAALQKLKVIFTSLRSDTIPEEIIFHDADRYPELGMQWAPATLGARFGCRTRRALQYVPGKGAVVQFRGWTISSVSCGTVRDPESLYVRVRKEMYRFSTRHVDQACYAELLSLSTSKTRFHIVLQPSSSHQIGIIVQELPDLVEPSDHVTTDVTNILRVRYVAGINGYLTEDRSVSQNLEEIDVSVLWPGHRSSGIQEQNGSLTIIDAEWTSDGKERYWCLA